MLTMMYLTPWLANTIAVSAIALVYVLVIRTWWVLKSIRAKANETSPTRQRRQAPIKTLVVLGSGGHTTEMLHLIKHLDPKQYTPLIYIVATTDTTSLKRVEALGGRTPDAIYHIPRSREVGQSYMSSVATTLWSFDHAVGLVMRIRPGVLLCNGPGTCLPIAVMTFVARLLGVCEGNIIFMESFCRVTSLSLTGKLLYPIVDLFVVHWETLLEKYPRSHLVTTFVPQRSSSLGSTERMKTNPEIERMIRD